MVSRRGTSKNGKEAMMLVSPEVTGLFGDNECISGTSTCQLLGLKPKTLEAVEYGPNGVRYKIEVLDIKPVLECGGGLQ